MKTDNFIQRIQWLSAIFLFFAAVIIARFADLQIIKGRGYAKRNMSFFSRDSVSRLGRGEIFIADRFGALFPLAVRTRIFTVFAEPKNISEKEITVSALAEALSLPYEIMRKKIVKKNDAYEIIASHVSEEDARRVKALHLKGVGVSEESGRYYPLETVAAHIAGFVGIRNDKKIGQYGVEGFYEKELEGEKGGIEKLVLSVDPNVQFALEEGVEEAVKRWSAAAGSAVVMEPSTGRILGMANYPAFNPNEYAKTKDISVFVNSVVSGQFELGSVFKPITMAAALNEKKVTPETIYDDTAGQVVISGYTIKNFDGKGHGKPTMTEVLEKSLNTGVIFAQQQIPKAVFRDYIEHFGFGAKTGVDVQGETQGNISNIKKERDLEFANASFGQGISVTPLQMISAISAIANGGLLMPPHFADKKIYRDGKEELMAPPPIQQVISEETSRILTKMLVATVENGYDKAKVPGYLIAGKTGTAQIPNENKRGYSEDTIHSFVGYAPAYQPRFAVLIKIDRPQEARFASQSLAPVFSKIMSYLLTYYEVPPDL